MSPPDEKRGRPQVPRRLPLVGIGFVVLIVCVVGYGLASRAAEHARLHDLTEDEAVPSVSIVAPSKVENQSGLELPGRLEAYIRAPIYARVAGYLKSWKYDIGARVKAGDVLAEIDTPDLDQQLMQARADLGVAQANASLAQISASRWQSLEGTDAVAKQDVDQRTYTYNASAAQVKAAQANVDRLVAEESFKRLVAPFDGIVTARETDVGALINVGASGGAELFVVSSTGKLRIYVNVPQNFVPKVPPGTRARITVPEHPGKQYDGVVEASAQAVNPSTGTTLMQIIVDNAGGEMMPGDYASIRLQTAAVADVYSVPSSALIFNAQGLFIATADDGSHVQLKTVVVARDLGQTVEIASGLSEADKVIQNPPDGVADGDQVRVLAPPPAAQKPAGGKPNNG